jgi:hypothetical protein
MLDMAARALSASLQTRTPLVKEGHVIVARRVLANLHLDVARL